jgi:hypothetical protein
MKSFLFTLFMAIFAIPSMADDVPAFPGAEGHGRYVTGGRGGEVRHVTTLIDDGKNSTVGTLRWAVYGSAKKMVVFDVGGVIPLIKELVIGDNTTIAGQTAPAPGITIRYYTVRPGANNIIRFIRIRRGQEKDVDDGADALWQRQKTGMMIDHCSFSWSIDEVASFYDNNNFTMQWCTVGESLNNAGHGKGAHGFGGIWGGKLASFHHNLICHVNNRSPRFNGARYNWEGYTNNAKYNEYQWENAVQAENVDFRNCVVYNCGNGCYGGPGGGQINMVNNYYKSGPAASTTRLTTVSVGSSDNANNYPIFWTMTSRYYLSGNQINSSNAGWSNVSYDNGTYNINGQQCSPDPNHYYGNHVTYYKNSAGTDCVPIKLDAPAPTGEVTTHSATTAFNKVLAYAGASLCRDNVDERYATEARNGTATYSGSVTRKKGRIDVVSDVNGYTEANFGTGAREDDFDTDQDGIPNEWETAHGLNPNDASDGNTYMLDTKRWYTNVEVYLNSLVEDIMKEGNAGATNSVNEYYPNLSGEIDDPVEEDEKPYCPFNSVKDNVTGVYENADFAALGISSSGKTLATGTIIGKTTYVTAAVGGSDNYKSSSYGPIYVSDYSWSGGIQGNANPKDANNGTPSSTLNVPTSGAFFTFDVTANGYLYVTHRSSSNKAYTIFEDGHPIGYIYSAISDKESLPTQYGYELKGSGENHVITEKVLTPEQITLQWDGKGDWTNIGASGLSVIKFPVRAGSQYVVNANGSKMTATGFYFDTTGDATVTVPNGGETVMLLEKGKLPGTSDYLLGDVNSDGLVNITDVVCLVNYILGETPNPFVFEAADINEDGTINITDAVGLVSIILH